MGKGKKSKKLNSIPAWGTDETQAQQAFQRDTRKSVRDSVRVKSSQNPPLSRVKELLYGEFKSKMNHMVTYAHPFKKPLIYKAGGDVKKRWYVYFYYLYPGSADKYKLFREEFGMNKIKTYRERYWFAQELQEFLYRKLIHGFNPFTDVNHEPESATYGILQQMELIRLKMSNNAGFHRTKTYKEMYNRFQIWIDQKEMQTIQMHHITIEHVKEFKAWCLFQKNLSAKTTNNSLSHLGMYWEEAENARMVYNNPFRSVPKAKKRDNPRADNQPIRFEPLKDQEMKDIFKIMREMKQHRFLNFCAFIYYAWARPIEILRLRISDIELDRGLIRFQKGQTKNGHASYVQIVKPLEDILRSMDLHKYPPDYYIFSRMYQPGKIMLSKINPSSRWRAVVKEKMGINKDLYALKHTGNIEYLQRNKGKADLKWQQMQNRHHSPTQTEAYNKRIGAYFIDLQDVNFRMI